MSLNLQSLLKISVAGAVLLTVGACKPADKGQGALKSETVAALNLSKTEASVFAKYFAVKDCRVDEMEALGALAGLGLGESGANGLSFASRNFDDGRVSYQNIEVKENGADSPSFKAETATFHCPSMGEEAPTFERLDLTEVNLRNDDVNFAFETLNIAKPTTDAASAIVSAMLDPDSGETGNIGFEAISLTGVTVTSKELFGSLETLSWGEIRNENGQGTADLTVETLDLTIPGKDGAQDMTFDFKGMSARNLNIGGTLSPQNALSPNGAVGSVLGSLNAFQKPYDTLLVDALKIDAEGFTLDFDGVEGQTTENGSVITTRQALKPMTISLKPALGEQPAFKQNYDILKSLGFETMELSGSSVTTLNSNDDSMTVTDGLLKLKDGFDLNFEYAAEGLSEMTAKMQEQAQSNTDVATLLNSYDALKLRNFRLTLEDKSIVERGLKLASEMTGQSEKNIKRSLGMAVFAAALAAENEVQAEVYSETTEAFAEFIKNGGTFTIEANPPEPVSLAPLITGQGADIDPATLGFSASQAGGTE